MDVKTFISSEVSYQEANLMVEFFQAFEPSFDPVLWIKLCEEELEEVKEAIAIVLTEPTDEHKAELLKEITDLRYVLVGLNAVRVPHFDVLLAEDSPVFERLKVLDEALTVLPEGFPVAFPMEVLQQAFFRVHTSNMSKLDEDGKAIRREDGKILKGPNYAAPDLGDLV